MNNKEWQHDAISLDKTGVMSWREIAQYLKVPKSTVSDFLRKYHKELYEEAENIYWLAEAEKAREGGYVGDDVKKDDSRSYVHLYIPDSQVKDGVPLDYLNWIGQYIVRKRPDVIIHGGDFADMPSLSSYDKGKRASEGLRVQKDIDIAIKGMEILLQPLRDLQDEQRKNGETVYSPRKVLTLGNHEDRINRHVEANPELHGFLSVDDLKYKDFGWEVIPYLTPINIHGVSYCHFFPNVMTGKPLSGTALNMLKTIGGSFTQGHKQTLDVATRFLPTDGRQQWGIVAGACYSHDETYKGVQGNHHWRGIIVKHNVNNGSYDPLFISLDWLEREYGRKYENI